MLAIMNIEDFVCARTENAARRFLPIVCALVHGQNVPRITVMADSSGQLSGWNRTDLHLTKKKSTCIVSISGPRCG